MIRRTRRPSLLGTAARTAVVAGTASSVVGRKEQRRAEQAQQAADAASFQSQRQQQAIEEAAAQALAGQQAQIVRPSQPAPDVLGQLERLADLMSKGLLSQEEFAAAKKSLLGL